MQTVDEALAKLQKSKFRSGFHLDEKNVRYIDEKAGISYEFCCCIF